MDKSLTNSSHAEYFYRKDIEQEIQRRIWVIVIAFPVLVLLFWGADWIYAPDKIWQFLGLRLTILPVALGVYFLLRSKLNVTQKLVVASFYAAWPANVITVMIYITGGSESIYRHGLILVALCALVFAPFHRKIFALSASLLFLPFFCAGLLLQSPIPIGSLLETLVIVSMVSFVSYYIAYFRDRYRFRLAEVRAERARELNYKAEIVEKKSSELFHLESLSHQFSPVIMNQMKQGKFAINQSFKQGEICAIFIGIDDFADKVLKLDKGKIRKIIDLFMHDTLQPLISRDITIDKFEGDKVLAFSNQPLEQKDYVDKVCAAAVEIRDNIKARSQIYSRLWRGEFHLKMGISVGKVTVGFFGREKSFQTYSAIGYPLPKAARLTSLSKKSKIIVDSQVRSHLSEDNYRFVDMIAPTLKGFENEEINIFELDSVVKPKTLDASFGRCNHCGSENLKLEEIEGMFNFRCNDCQGIVISANPGGNKNRIAS